MNLIIVESPTKARTLSRFLDKNYSVEATMGHIKDLPKSKLGVDIEKDFEPDYLLIEKRKKEIQKIKSASKKANLIFLASDPDREGEAIAAHVKEEIGNGKTRRIVFHEISKEAVFEAIKNPRDINSDLVNAQIARRVLDRLVGYKLSPLLWKKVRRGLSAGRVQSVAVRLIVEREREIENFTPEEYWEIAAELAKSGDKKTFIASLTKIKDKKAEVKNKNEADDIVKDLSGADYKVEDVSTREIRNNPYPPFTTSTMTQSASRLFGWSSKKTMSVAQKLYEEGLITYHRTDSTNLSRSAVQKARSLIQKEFGAKYLPQKERVYKTKSKSAQEAHEAIRVVDPFLKEPETKGRFANDSLKLYKLIWKRFLACQMSEALYDRKTIIVSAFSKYILKASGQTMKFDGWTTLYASIKDSSESVIYLPEVKKGEILDFIKIHKEQRFTQPPPRFNEASLIKTLEQLGIGRPSTYVPTISTILFRNYVEKDEGKFVPTAIGTAVNDFLVKNFPEVFDYGFTAEMEENLDKIAEGNSQWKITIKKFWDPFANKLEVIEQKAERVKIETEKLGKKCPECKTGELVIRTGRFGKFISCSRFPDCKYTEKYEQKLKMKCPECKKGEVVIKKTKKGRKFFGCSRYPDCTWASWTDPKKK